jgi:outer membrane protein
VLVLVLALLVLGISAKGYAQQRQSAPGTRAEARSVANDSLTVEAVVEQVLETYPSIEAARRDVDAATARVGQARSRYWPRVSAAGTYRRQDPVPEITVPGTSGGTAGAGEGRTVGIQPNNLYDGHLQVRQTLYDFGKTDARVRQAEAGQTVAERRVEVERTELAFQAVEAFYTTLLADARLEVQHDQVDQLKRTLAVVRRQKEAGTATEYEVQSTRTRLSAARSRLTEFRSQRQRQKAELQRLLGRAAGPSVVPHGTMAPSLTPADSGRIEADTLVAHGLLRHPSVRAAKAQVRAARRTVGVAEGADSPTLSLDARGGVKNGYPAELNEPRFNESIGISLNVPLFEGFATRRQVEEAQAQVRAAEARLMDVQRQVRTHIEQAASDLRARLDRLTSTQQRVEQAQAAARLARTRYEAGTITNLELLDAETALREARLEQTEIQYQVVMGRYALRRAAGTLLPFEALP